MISGNILNVMMSIALFSFTYINFTILYPPLTTNTHYILDMFFYFSINLLTILISTCFFYLLFSDPGKVPKAYVKYILFWLVWPLEFFLLQCTGTWRWYRLWTIEILWFMLYFQTWQNSSLLKVPKVHFMLWSSLFLVRKLYWIL